MYKVIDSDDYGASGIETLTMPGGEPHLKFHGERFQPDILFAKVRTMQDAFFAALVCNALKPRVLFMPYFPGARQDKHNEYMTMHVYYDMVIQSISELQSFDVHSSYTEQISDCQWMPSDLNVPIMDDVVGIIAPDEGAHDRASNFKEKFYPDAELIQCTKERDPTTGRLSNYQMPDLGPYGRYIVVDDICDGGGTFNLLAKAFKGQNTNNRLELFVSHGIFSHKLGLGNIDPVYEHITTTDSWCQIDKVKGYWKVEDGRLSTVPRLTVLPLAQLFDRIMEE